jgi:hypothetical protein
VQLTVRHVSGNLLAVEPLDLGPGVPATAALQRERGTRPDVTPERGDQ